MATYKLNRRAIARARRLIDARQYVLNSDRGESQPTADDENVSTASLSALAGKRPALWRASSLLLVLRRVLATILGDRAFHDVDSLGY